MQTPEGVRKVRRIDKSRRHYRIERAIQRRQLRKLKGRIQEEVE